MPVTVYDQFGNLAAIPPGALSVVLTQGSADFAATIVQDADGNYFAQATLEQAGVPVTVNAQINGQTLPGSGFALETTVGAPSAEASVPTGTGTSGQPSPAGTTQSISIAPTDAFGNPIPNAPGYSVTVSFVPPDMPPVTVTAPDPVTGLYTVDYDPTVAGTYTMVVTVTDPQGNSVPTEYPLVVQPGALSAAASRPVAGGVSGVRSSGPIAAGSPAVVR
eukprot:6438082-Pyramimonas_sp.AAC.1